MYNRNACDTGNICIHHVIVTQHKHNHHIMTIYIILTINILRFCLGMHESSASVALHVVESDISIKLPPTVNRT